MSFLSRQWLLHLRFHSETRYRNVIELALYTLITSSSIAILLPDSGDIIRKTRLIEPLALMMTLKMESVLGHAESGIFAGPDLTSGNAHDAALLAPFQNITPALVGMTLQPDAMMSERPQLLIASSTEGALFFGRQNAKGHDGVWQMTPEEGWAVRWYCRSVYPTDPTSGFTFCRENAFPDRKEQR